MSSFRCFNNNINYNTTSSDYISEKKNKTIFNNTQKSIDNNANVIKKNNGYNYNEIRINDAGCLGSAPDYNTLLSVTKGRYLCNPILEGNFTYNINEANLIAVDISGYCSVIPYVDDNSCNTIIYPPTTSSGIYQNISGDGIVIDPCNNIFYTGCEYDKTYNENIVRLNVNESNNLLYKQIESNFKLNHFNYPKKFSFLSHKDTTLTFASAIQNRTYSLDVPLNAIWSVTIGTNSISFRSGTIAYLTNTYSGDTTTLPISSPTATQTIGGTTITVEGYFWFPAKTSALCKPTPGLYEYIKLKFDSITGNPTPTLNNAEFRRRYPVDNGCEGTIPSTLT